MERTQSPPAIRSPRMHFRCLLHMMTQHHQHISEHIDAASDGRQPEPTPIQDHYRPPTCDAAADRRSTMPVPRGDRTPLCAAPIE
ncbi:hypothetical protein GY45DRAFT_1034713 [Cubamyces sp. BRFM 1775]|nr:hypothetical protein GY45DRAFT_1034713 [Cubamyces sp. BRFM 1775]